MSVAVWRSFGRTPGKFLLVARGLRGAKGEANAIENAVSAIFRDPGWSGGEGGSGQVLVDNMGQSSAE